MKIKDLLLLPVMIALFFIDRALLVFIFWENSFKFDKWLYQDEQILKSISRVMVVSLIVSIYILFSE